jgi:H+/Cl- antiporter ClcA
MKRFINLSLQYAVTKNLLRWTLLALPIAFLAGSSVAFFLWALDEVTRLHWQHQWLLYLLPMAGIAIYFIYHTLGKKSEAGNNLVMEEIHRPGGGVPARMAPLVLLTTLITHLFGGSAGREGTAVQMAGSLAGLIARVLKLQHQDTRILLMMGIAAGFGAVFGTPVAGAIFALEVLAIGTIRYDALVPCLIAGILADISCMAWGIQHTHYHISTAQAATQLIAFIHTDWRLLGKAILAGVAFGLCSYLFTALQQGIKYYSQQYIRYQWLIPVCGGALIILLCVITGTRDYTGLGILSPDANGVSIVSSFYAGGAHTWSWLLKLIFTAITLGMGFKGGEVTPLFFIGAALGNTIAVLTGAPVDLFAGLGFIAVFAGATNTPVACTIMGVELFGGENILYYAVACFTAYYFSGHAGIYSAQKLAVNKTNQL